MTTRMTSPAPSANAVNRLLERLLDEVRLPEEIPVDLHALRQRSLDVVERRFDPLGQLQRVHGGLLLNADDHRGSRVVRAFAALDRGAFPHGPDIADEHGRRIGRFDGDRGDRLGVAKPSDAADQVLLTFGDLKTGRRISVRGRQRRFDLLERHLVGRQTRRIEHHLVLLLLASRRDHLRHAGNGEQPPPNDRLGDGAQFQRRMAIRLEIDEEHFAHDRRHGREEGRLDVRRQRACHERELLRHRLPRPGDVLTPVEFDPDDRDADSGRRAHPTHARGAVQRRLDGERDQRLNLERVHAGRFGQDRDRGGREIRQHVERNSRCGPSAPHEKGGSERHHDGAMPERPANQCVNHLQPRSVHVPMCRNRCRQ